MCLGTVFGHESLLWRNRGLERYGLRLSLRRKCEPTWLFWLRRRKLGLLWIYKSFSSIGGLQNWFLSFYCGQYLYRVVSATIIHRHIRYLKFQLKISLYLVNSTFQFSSSSEYTILGWTNTISTTNRQFTSWKNCKYDKRYPGIKLSYFVMVVFILETFANKHEQRNFVQTLEDE